LSRTDWLDVTDGVNWLDVTTVESGNGEEGSMTGMFLRMFVVVDVDVVVVVDGVEEETLS
jgi:hypothetical protein